MEVVTPALPGCELITSLGKGSFGIVLLVRERATGEFFAAKIMNKKQLKDDGVLENVTIERQVLRDAGPHPFVVECHSGIQTEVAVVLILEYLSGGDMYDLLRSQGTLTEENAAFYLAEVAIAIEELHQRNFVLRDLKLENILLDGRGHIRLTDFGLAAKLSGRSDTSCVDLSGTAIYQAPEILNKTGHGASVDWWAFGVLAFVVMIGKPPFNSPDLSELYRRIRQDAVVLDGFGFSDRAIDLISKLLTKNPNERLCSKRGVNEIMEHPFFSSIDWVKLGNMDIQPPFPPPKGPPPQEDIDNPLSEDTLEAFREFEARLRESGSGDNVVVRDYHVIVAPSGRPSIGLDFQGLRRDGDRRTWTGTTDDFGRVVTTPVTGMDSNHDAPARGQ